MANEFKLFKLNEDGQLKLEAIAKEFATLMARVEALVPTGRERALVATKLQEGLAFVTRGLEMQKAYRAEEE